MRKYNRAKTTAGQRIRLLASKCDGTPCTAADIAAAWYTILDISRGYFPVPYHATVEIDLERALGDVKTDPETGKAYNFEYIVEAREDHQPFQYEGTCYRLDLVLMDKARKVSAHQIYYRT